VHAEVGITSRASRTDRSDRDDRADRGDRSDRQRRSRWIVHLGLIVSFAAALVSLLLFHGSRTPHIVLGLVFVALVLVHIGQRRRTVGRLAAQLVRARAWHTPRGRLAWSDVILALLTVNVLVSGTVDWVVGYNTPLPVQSLGLHTFIGWHAFSSVLLLAYLLVHVFRRRRRLKSSHIR